MSSLRFQIRCAVPAAIVAGVVSIAWHPLLLPVAFAGWVVCMWLGITYGDTEYFCPRCGKALRTARDAVRCHHCGYDLATSATNSP